MLAGGGDNDMLGLKVNVKRRNRGLKQAVIKLICGNVIRRLGLAQTLWCFFLSKKSICFES